MAQYIILFEPPQFLQWSIDKHGFIDVDVVTTE